MPPFTLNKSLLYLYIHHTKFVDMQKYLNLLQKGIINILLVIISILLILSIIDVVLQLYIGLTENTMTEFLKNQFGQLVGLFLTILIGVELLEAVKAFLKEEIIHVEIIVLIAIIAIARKVIVWEISSYTYQDLIALSLMLIALAATYWVIKVCYKKPKCKKPNDPNCIPEN